MTDRPIEIRNQSFTGDVDVDGKYFIKCRFEKAKLRYAGGVLPTFKDCQTEDVSWYFHGAALRTIQLLQAQNYHGDAQELIDTMFKPGAISFE
jgi:hypothetical protein